MGFIDSIKSKLNISGSHTKRGKGNQSSVINTKDEFKKSGRQSSVASDERKIKSLRAQIAKDAEKAQIAKDAEKAELAKDTGEDSSLKVEGGGLLDREIQRNLDNMKDATSSNYFSALVETVGLLTSNPDASKEVKISVLNEFERQEEKSNNFRSVKTLPVATARIGASGDKEVKTRAYSLISKWLNSWTSAKSGKPIKEAVTVLFSDSGAEDSDLASRATDDLIHTMDNVSNAGYYAEMADALGNVASSPSASKETKMSVLNALEKQEKSCSNVKAVKSLPVAAAKIGASGDKEVKTKAYNLINKWDNSWTNTRTTKSLEEAKRILFA